jgi:protein ImuA
MAQAVNGSQARDTTQAQGTDGGDPDAGAVPDLETLRRRVRALERGAGPQATSVLPLGARAIDEALPGGGLSRAGVHELLPERTAWDDGPAAGFALAIAGRLMAAANGPVLWIARRGDLYAPGTPAFGVDPDRLLSARAGDDAGVLWAMEEALRCPELAGVVGEVGQLDRTAARRLQLAAEAGQVMGLTLLRRRVVPRGRQDPSAAVTRWRVGARPARRGGERAGDGAVSGGGFVPGDSPVPGGGRARWHLELVRARGGHPADFEVEWDHATGDFALAAALRDTAAADFRSGGVPGLRRAS